MIEKANLALPHLVNHAKDKKTLTYKELAALINYHYRHLSKPLEYIRDYCIENKLPLINVIVVNAKTQRPGINYLGEDISSLSKEEQKRIFKKHRDAVFSYTEWKERLEEYNREQMSKSKS